MIKVLVVDDEASAGEELVHLIQQDKDFEVVGRAEDGQTALEKLKKEKIDGVFLDIEMPGMKGLEVAGELARWEKPPLVVFVTAFHQYAVEAFEANAIDYVLKPYELDRLKKTLEKVKKFLKGNSSSKEKLTSLEDALIAKGVIKKLVGHRRNFKDRIVIDPQEVCFFKAQYSEVIAYTEAQELIMNSSLKEVMDNLDSAQFAQVHKGYIANLNRIEKVSPMFSGNFEITFKGAKGYKIPMSRRFSRALKARIGTW